MRRSVPLRFILKLQYLPCRARNGQNYNKYCSLRLKTWVIRYNINSNPTMLKPRIRKNLNVPLASVNSGGDTLGLVEGDRVGLNEGNMLGISLGKEVGILLGKGVGISLGEEVGISLGKEAGISLGKELGISLGEKVGISLGKEVGILLCKEVGISLGLIELLGSDDDNAKMFPAAGRLVVGTVVGGVGLAVLVGAGERVGGIVG